MLAAIGASFAVGFPDCASFKKIQLLVSHYYLSFRFEMLVLVAAAANAHEKGFQPRGTDGIVAPLAQAARYIPGIDGGSGHILGTQPRRAWDLTARGAPSFPSSPMPSPDSLTLARAADKIERGDTSFDALCGGLIRTFARLNRIEAAFRDLSARMRILEERDALARRPEPAPAEAPNGAAPADHKAAPNRRLSERDPPSRATARDWQLCAAVLKSAPSGRRRRLIGPFAVRQGW